MSRVKILYATQTGNAESCADHLLECLQERGLEAEVRNVADFPPRCLGESHIALLILGSWRQGEPPREAVGFYHGLKDLPPGLLNHLHFAVIALAGGDSAFFSDFGREVDWLLSQAGAERLCERLDYDPDRDGRLPVWIESVLEQVAHVPVLVETTQ